MKYPLVKIEYQNDIGQHIKGKWSEILKPLLFIQILCTNGKKSFRVI